MNTRENPGKIMKNKTRHAMKSLTQESHKQTKNVNPITDCGRTEKKAFQLYVSTYYTLTQTTADLTLRT